jgi:hypothetical protein
MENDLPIVVFDLRLQDSISRAAAGLHSGTRVGNIETALAEAAAGTST